jgi:shikimate kinase
MRRVFIVGPGGVGKSTAGEILAKTLKYYFVDLDTAFCTHIENIGTYIRREGYAKYCQTNSNLFYDLLSRLAEDTVFVLSSGFLAHEDMDKLTSRHAQTLKAEGVTLCLLPSVSLEESLSIVVNRQMKRGWKLDRSNEEKKFRRRYPIYQECGDIQIYSSASPQETASLMKKELIERSYISK